MAVPEIVAPGACDLTASGVVGYAKDADTPMLTASTIKCLVLFVARRWITDGMLDDTVTVVEDDMIGGSTAGLKVGDIITWHDLFHGLMLPSGNDAAKAIARCVGQLITDAGVHPDAPPVTYEPNPLRGRFVAEMRHVATTVLDWQQTPVIETVSGADMGTRMTPRQLCELMLALDPYAVAVAGKLAHTFTVGGPEARSITLAHTINPDGAVKFPEFIAGKTGTSTISNVVLLWEDANGRHATAIMEAPTSAQRYVDARAVMDYVKVVTLPPTELPLPVVLPTGAPIGYRTKVGGEVVDVSVVKFGLGGTGIHVWP